MAELKTSPSGPTTSPPGTVTPGATVPGAVAPTQSLPVANRGLRPANALARSLFRVLYGGPLQWKNPTLGGISWSTLTWDSVAWDSVAWDSVAWDAFTID